jgi:N-acetyl-D-muramate 6-phosphate phosphatase
MPRTVRLLPPSIQVNTAVTTYNPRIIDTVLFDLDGTLADTAPDMTSALNELLCEQGRKPLPFDMVRNHVSRGAAGVLRVAFGVDLADAELESLRERFLQLYAANLCVETCVFPGMHEVLAHIEALGSKWGVVTNKPAWLTDRLIEALGLTARTACVISGDTTDQKKPHPKPLLHACACCGVEAERCVYIGDDPRDIQAAKAAGMASLVAVYGYIGEEQDPYAWGADGVLEDIAELPIWLRLASTYNQATG